MTTNETPDTTPDVEALIGRIDTIKYGHVLGEHELPIIVDAIRTLRTLTARIAELEAEYRELDCVMQEYIAQAAKAERAKCGERIEEMAGTLKTTAERLHSKGKFADAARYMDYSGAMLSFGKHAIAADHIEANGRNTE